MWARLARRALGGIATAERDRFANITLEPGQNTLLVAR